MTRSGEMGQKVSGPNAKLLSGGARAIIGGIHKKTGALHEKVNRVLNATSVGDNANVAD